MARPPAIETDTALWLALDVSSLRLTDDQLLRLFRDNDEYQFELSAKGELIIMSPANNKTDLKNTTIITRLRNWTEQDGTGVSFGNNTLFTLPNGAKRGPDAILRTPRSRSSAVVRGFCAIELLEGRQTATVIH